MHVDLFPPALFLLLPLSLSRFPTSFAFLTVSLALNLSSFSSIICSSSKGVRRGNTLGVVWGIFAVVDKERAWPTLERDQKSGCGEPWRGLWHTSPHCLDSLRTPGQAEGQVGLNSRWCLSGYLSDPLTVSAMWTEHCSCFSTLLLLIATAWRCLLQQQFSTHWVSAAVGGFIALLKGMGSTWLYLFGFNLLWYEQGGYIS